MSSIFSFCQSVVVVLGCILFGQGEVQSSLRLIEPKHVQETRTATDIFNLEENMPRIVFPRGPIEFFFLDRPDYKEWSLFQINKVVRRFQSVTGKPEAYEQANQASGAEDHLNQRPRRGIFRGLRSPPLSAKIAFAAPLWILAWLLFYSGLNCGIGTQNGSAALRFLGFCLIMGITVWWIIP